MYQLSPITFALSLLARAGSPEAALAAFDESRNSSDGWLCLMPQEWCIEVADFIADSATVH